MTKPEFITKVLYILNEADADISGADMIGSDMTKLEQYIENLYPAAWRRAVSLLPLSWFEKKSFSTSTKVVNATDGTGYIILPDDYLKLSSFKMTAWKQSCMEANDETPAINRKQANEYLRGNIYKPVCVLRFINHESALKKAMWYYSLPRTTDEATHVVETALYIPNVTILATNAVIDNKLSEPLAYICASTVLISLEKTDSSKGIESLLLEMIK